MMPALAWYLMQLAVLRRQGAHSSLERALGSDLKGKISPVVYILGIAASFFNTVVADACYVAVSMIWLIPDRRMESQAEG